MFAIRPSTFSFVAVTDTDAFFPASRAASGRRQLDVGPRKSREGRGERAGVTRGWTRADLKKGRSSPLAFFRHVGRAPHSSTSSSSLLTLSPPSLLPPLFTFSLLSSFIRREVSLVRLTRGPPALEYNSQSARARIESDTEFSGSPCHADGLRCHRARFQRAGVLQPRGSVRPRPLCAGDRRGSGGGGRQRIKRPHTKPGFRRGR